MKLCPHCGRYGVERSWYGFWICLWNDCGYQAKDYIKPYIGNKQKFKKFADSLNQGDKNE